MRIEPKMYESTKPKDAAVDTDVVEAYIVDDGFLDMVSRFFKWIGDNVEFEEYKLDNENFDHMAMGDPRGLIGTTQYKD